ncbi:hypothetical protein [Muricomes intestini]|jgi:hypothetical protein|uniref:hypothetical protein n=1 Tax=Muricomes intestini TaxID=1796634 RepID=UPI00140479AB|nr:hypothetical protein [Muricomes intestini]
MVENIFKAPPQIVKDPAASGRGIKLASESIRRSAGPWSGVLKAFFKSPKRQETVPENVNWEKEE